MGGGGSRPKPPKVTQAPPPARDIDIEYVSPTMVQELARRQKQGAFVTKGQSLGQEGQVLGAKPTELANIQEASGISFNPALGNLDQILGDLQTPEEFFADKSQRVYNTSSETSNRSLIDIYTLPMTTGSTRGEAARKAAITEYSKAQVIPQFLSYQLTNLGLQSYSEFQETNKTEIDKLIASRTQVSRKPSVTIKTIAKAELYQKYYDDAIKRNKEYRSQQRQGMII
mgnify:CR=1 FL=1|tara:strand:+ start:1195 stop:1878 length:684 start_codon:yes stop_codon:yes gene_type:complete